MDTSIQRHPNNSASETTLNQLMDMFVVILGQNLGS
jgi:hypothetical protein